MAEHTNFSDFSDGTAADLLKTWTEVGTQTWKSWLDLMGSAIPSPVADRKPEFETMTQRFLSYQQLQIHLLKLSFQAWQDLCPKIESGEDWQASLNHYIQKLDEQVKEFTAGTAKNTQDTAELWQIYLQEIETFNQLWSQAGASLDPLNQAAVSHSSKAWIELNRLHWNLTYGNLDNLTQIPLLGPSRDFNHQLMQAFDAWAKLYPVSIDYQGVLAEVQIQSCQTLLQDLIASAEKGETVKDWQQFQQIWGRTTDRVFEQTFCLEANLKVRGRFLNALNHYKSCQQSLMEVWMKMMNLPVRSEIDEVHKSIYELRKEVKNLKKSLAKYETAQATPPLETPPEDSPETPPEEPPAHEQPPISEHWTTAIFTRKR